MTITELIEKLKFYNASWGDIEVRVFENHDAENYDDTPILPYEFQIVTDGTGTRLVIGK